jgi:hypothetical protein
MSILGTVCKLILPTSQTSPAREAPAASPAASQVSRRAFFSFFGTGVAMLAKPDLFLPKLIRPKSITVPFLVDYSVRWEVHTQEWLFYQLLQGKAGALLPSVPAAIDGAAIYGKWLPIDVACEEWNSP